MDAQDMQDWIRGIIRMLYPGYNARQVLNKSIPDLSEAF